jgi:YesN/AraC family two-component response regulator
MKHKLLIVDDDPEVTQSFLYLLRDEYTITAVPSGKKAVGIVKAEADIDLIVLDYRLEDISGIEALREIRAINNDVPVLFVTGFGNEEVVVRAFKNGIDDYIKKPFGYFELRDKIISLISDRDNEERNRRTPINSEETIARQREKSLCNPGNYYKIQRALKFIHDNFMRKISRDEVAKEACMEPTYFSKIFKEVTGSGFRDYVNECRITKAIELLSNGRRLSITETALALGFGDITTFERTFKKKVGLTPLQYRNSIYFSVTTYSDVA